MNWQQVKGGWKEVKGQVKGRWGRLTDDDLTAIAGDHERLLGRLQRRYGLTQEEAQRQIDEFRWK